MTAINTEIPWRAICIRKNRSNLNIHQLCTGWTITQPRYILSRLKEELISPHKAMVGLLGYTAKKKSQCIQHMVFFNLRIGGMQIQLTLEQHRGWGTDRPHSQKPAYSSQLALHILSSSTSMGPPHLWFCICGSTNFISSSISVFTIRNSCISGQICTVQGSTVYTLLLILKNKRNGLLLGDKI